MRAAAHMAGDRASRRAVLLETEVGAVTGLTSTEDTRGNVMTNTGSGYEQDRADRARTLDASNIEAGVRG